MNKYKIIIVENDEDEQFFMKESFVATGLFDIVAQAKNGDELMDFLRDNPCGLPDLILSDLNMPGKDGFDVLAAISKSDEYKHIPVIITSTSSTKSMIEKCLSLGASNYMVKPDTFIEYVPFVKTLHDFICEKHLVKQSSFLVSS